AERRRPHAGKHAARCEWRLVRGRLAELDRRPEGLRGGGGEAAQARGAWSSERFVGIEKQVAHRYGAPVRIRHLRVFHPGTSTIIGPVSVLVNGTKIAAVEPPDSPATPGEVTIDGAGGTVVAGFYEMHAHLGESGALLNLMAGITTVRDMGNDNAVLDAL